jgi:hypothetical protein
MDGHGQLLAVVPYIHRVLSCPLPRSGSTYLHKDRDKPVAAGPIWDLNEAFGLCCGYPIEGWDKDGVSGPGGHDAALKLVARGKGGERPHTDAY